MASQWHDSTTSLIRPKSATMSKDAGQTEIRLQTKTSQQTEHEPTPVNPWDPSEYPDGGFEAWSVLAGAFCCLFCSFGWINCIGIFQEFYQSHYLHDYTPSAVSLIASLELFFQFAGGLLVGKVYDRFGPRPLLLFGTVAHVSGLMLASISTKYYQILLSQGVVSPIGISCLFSPSMNCVITWFRKKRGFANGIAAAGSSLGGVVFPIVFNRLVIDVGFPWAMRICAFLILFLLIIANLTLKARIPPQPRRTSLKYLFKPLTERTYLLASLASCVFVLGLYLPINFIQAQGVHLGMERSLAHSLVSILNAASFFGRTIPGFAADRLGALNVQTFMCFFTGVLALALWIPAASDAGIVTFAVLYGFGSGALVALVPTIVAQISEIHEIGVRLGLEFALIAIPILFSNLIGGAFVLLNSDGYLYCQIWTGCILMLGSILMLFARISQGGTRFMTKV